MPYYYVFNWINLPIINYIVNHLIILIPKPEKPPEPIADLTKVSGELVLHIRFCRNFFANWGVDREFADPYIVIIMPDEISRKTKEKRITLHPVFNESFTHRLLFEDAE